MPANTGVAGANYRVACFAGMPAPTEILLVNWLRGYPETANPFA